MTEPTRHERDHGWTLPDGSYLCDGCNVRGVHEHRCHGRDGGPPCSCSTCKPPSAAELSAFMRGLEC